MELTAEELRVLQEIAQQKVAQIQIQKEALYSALRTGNIANIVAIIKSVPDLYKKVKTHITILEFLPHFSVDQETINDIRIDQIQQLTPIVREYYAR